jgi:hypothetical protein
VHSNGATARSGTLCTTNRNWVSNKARAIRFRRRRLVSGIEIVSSQKAEDAKGGRIPGELAEIHLLWLNAGLSSDGDTIAMTAATQPSIEDLIQGKFSWIPKVNFHNLFLV